MLDLPPGAPLTWLKTALCCFATSLSSDFWNALSNQLPCLQRPYLLITSRRHLVLTRQFRATSCLSSNDQPSSALLGPVSVSLFPSWSRTATTTTSPPRVGSRSSAQAQVHERRLHPERLSRSRDDCVVFGFCRAQRTRRLSSRPASPQFRSSFFLRSSILFRDPSPSPTSTLTASTLSHACAIHVTFLDSFQVSSSFLEAFAASPCRIRHFLPHRLRRVLHI